MDPLIEIIRFGIYAVMGLSAAAALAAVLAPNLFHAALGLIGTLIGTAFIFIVLRADFLAAVQILLYVGAVMTLVIFAIMLTEGLGTKNLRPENKLKAVALLALLFFFGILVRAILKTPWPVRAENLTAKIDTLHLGKTLMSGYAFPFEIISVVLIAVLIGSIMIAKKDQEAG